MSESESTHHHVNGHTSNGILNGVAKLPTITTDNEYDAELQAISAKLADGAMKAAETDGGPPVGTAGGTPAEEQLASPPSLATPCNSLVDEAEATEKLTAAGGGSAASQIDDVTLFRKLSVHQTANGDPDSNLSNTESQSVVKSHHDYQQKSQTQVEDSSEEANFDKHDPEGLPSRKFEFVRIENVEKDAPPADRTVPPVHGANGDVIVIPATADKPPELLADSSSNSPHEKIFSKDLAEIFAPRPPNGSNIPSNEALKAGDIETADGATADEILVILDDSAATEPQETAGSIQHIEEPQPSTDKKSGTTFSEQTVAPNAESKIEEKPDVEPAVESDEAQSVYEPVKHDELSSEPVDHESNTAFDKHNVDKESENVTESHPSAAVHDETEKLEDNESKKTPDETSHDIINIEAENQPQAGNNEVEPLSLRNNEKPVNDEPNVKSELEDTSKNSANKPTSEDHIHQTKSREDVEPTVTVVNAHTVETLSQDIKCAGEVKRQSSESSESSDHANDSSSNHVDGQVDEVVGPALIAVTEQAVAAPPHRNASLSQEAPTEQLLTGEIYYRGLQQTEDHSGSDHKESTNQVSEENKHHEDTIEQITTIASESQASAVDINPAENKDEVAIVQSVCGEPPASSVPRTPPPAAQFNAEPKSEPVLQAQAEQTSNAKTEAESKPGPVVQSPVEQTPKLSEPRPARSLDEPWIPQQKAALQKHISEDSAQPRTAQMPQPAEQSDELTSHKKRGSEWSAGGGGPAAFLRKRCTIL